VEAALQSLAPALAREGITLHADVFRPSTFIDLALRNITTSLLLGALLVSVILMLFLADLRTAAISLTAIPLSLLSATILLEVLGFSINTLTLGGLAIALGEVVDDAIIDVENIARRLREQGTAITGDIGEVVVRASLEVRGSVVYATFVVALVFLPVLALTECRGPCSGRWRWPTSLPPSHRSRGAHGHPGPVPRAAHPRNSRDHESRVLLYLKRGYATLLSSLFKEPVAVLVATVVLCIGAVATLPFFGATFLPEFREGHYLIHMSAVPGTSLEESVRLGRIVSARLLEDKRVRLVAQRAGRAELSEDTWGTHYTEFEVDLVPLTGKAAETVQDDLRRTLEGIPGVNFAIRGFLAERIEETLTGSTAQVVVKLFGDDLDSLDLSARRMAETIGRVRGATDVQYDPPPVAPEVTVRLRPFALASVGIRPDEALEAVETATRGATVAQVFDGSRTTDVVVILDSASRRRPEQLRRIPLSNVNGRIVSLQSVADVERTTGRYLVSHQGTRRVVTVTANVQGRDVAGFARELENTARASVNLPAGIFADYGGTAAAQRSAQRELLLNSLLTGLGILMLLGLAFGEVDRLSLVLLNLPFALVGGVLAVFATGGVLSLGSLVGFVTLFGHRHPQRRHAPLALRSPGQCRGRPVGHGHRPSRCHGAARPDPHDRPRHRHRSPAARTRQR
jgi:Cu/Ag efflux pump CusA